MPETIKQEYWLSGPVEGIIPLLQPVAHALLQAQRELSEALQVFPPEKLWVRPAGVASVGFHLQHLRGVMDRLFTYAREEQLSAAQMEYLQAEGLPANQENVQSLLEAFHQQMERALAQLKATEENVLLDTRYFGRKKIPSNVLGLLFHAAEHTQRHTGQLLVTARILQGND